MIVLDTTVLVYAVGSDHTFREPCRQLMSAIETGAVQASTTVEVIQEFTHVRARRRSRNDAADLAGAFADLLSPLLVIDEAVLHTGLRLFRGHDRLGAFDAVLSAGAIAAGAGALVSADGAFADVAGLRHVVPDAAGLAALLAESS